jgi:NADH-quinone oxidoreductase subunit H
MEMETGPVSLITAITVVEIKETIIPLESSHWIFLGAPFLTFYLALVNWVVLPLEFGIAISEVLGGGILIIIAISELSIYGVIFSGWAANSKYPLLGS